MAQNKISLNLSAADFTLSYRFKGPSVIVPANDQNAYAAQQWFTGDIQQRGTNIPQVAYCENTVPTSEGYRSVAYRYFIDPPEVPGEFIKVLTLFDGQGASALVGVTKDRRLYVCSAFTSGTWIVLNLPVGYAWSEYLGITNAAVHNLSLLCIRGVGVFNLNVASSSLAPAGLTGIVESQVVGISSSKGYLIAYDETKIYWSSTEDPTDFVPSLITGAGSGTPEGLKGKIILCKEIDQGFIIYTDVSIISAAYSANSAIPWVFAITSGGAGIRHEDAVAYDINMSRHFAWTSSGLTGVELHTASPILPQITDFIASGLSDKTTGYQNLPSTIFDDRDKEVRLAIISNRYVCISFGYLRAKMLNEGTQPQLIQSFIWDTQLKRWGKLNVDHIQILETPFTAASPVFF